MTNYSAPPYYEVDTVFFECPALDGTTVAAMTQDKYKVSCGVNSRGGMDAAGGGVITDLIAIVAYSAMDCINACSEFNTRVKSLDTDLFCSTIVWMYFMANTTAWNGGNCWLKNGTLAQHTAPAYDSYALTAELR